MPGLSVISALIAKSMHLERDETAFLLACVCGFIGGCASGYAMSKSRKQGFIWIAVSVSVGIGVWVAYQIDGLPQGQPSTALFGFLIYVALMAGVVLLPTVLGCSLTWLVLYLRAFCRRRRGNS